MADRFEFVHFAFGVFGFKVLALVEEVFASRQGDVQFGKAFVVDKQCDWDDSESLFLNFTFQFSEFACCQQEFTVALGNMIVVSSQRVFRNVHAKNEQFITFKRAI